MKIIKGSFIDSMDHFSKKLNYSKFKTRNKVLHDFYLMITITYGLITLLGVERSKILNAKLEILGNEGDGVHIKFFVPVVVLN